MKDKSSESLDTRIVNAGRDEKWTQGVINVPVVRASTCVFDSVEQMKRNNAKRADKALFYGRRGTQTGFAFSEAIAELEGGVGTYLYPCGTAAITSSLLAFLQAGDHLLMVDTVYEPTRDFCDKVLAKMGVETSYYDPMIGDGLSELIRPNTRVLFLESPGSNTMEVQDVPGLAKIAHAHDIVVMLDNTWASPILCRPFDMGVDVSIQAATKYIVGHSDAMLGTATANGEHWPQLREQSYLLGQCVAADDIYMGARGLRTLSVRLKQHEQNAFEVANWLSQHPKVGEIRHPAFSSNPGHEFFKRDFSGANGLFSFVLPGASEQGIVAMLDGMQHFKMGYSWGGFESLILKVNGLDRLRTATTWTADGPLIRVHIGLEDPGDLIRDLDAGIARAFSV